MRGQNRLRYAHDVWLVVCVVVAFLVGGFLAVYPHGSDMTVFIALVWVALTALVAGLVARDELLAQKAEQKKP